jgi:hypothetical protein
LTPSAGVEVKANPEQTVSVMLEIVGDARIMITMLSLGPQATPVHPAMESK